MQVRNKVAPLAKERKLCAGSVIRMKTVLVFILLAGSSVFAVEANPEEIKEQKEAGFNFIPIGIYGYASLGSQGMHSPGFAAALKKDKTMYVGSYQNIRLSEEPLYDVGRNFHAINFLGDIYHGAWNILAIFRSESDDPFGGGLRTMQFGSALGYDLFHGKKSSFILGLGIAVGDFGVELSDGSPLYVIPIPFVRYQTEGNFMKVDFSFLTGPNLALTLAPKSKVRITNDLRFDRLRDAGDLIFESLLWYRFFDSNHEYGDFAGVGVGLKREDASYDMADREDLFSIQYYGALVVFDISVLKISGGYAFDAVERHGDEFKRGLENGFFGEIQCLYQF